MGIKKKIKKAVTKTVRIKLGIGSSRKAQALMQKLNRENTVPYLKSLWGNGMIYDLLAASVTDTAFTAIFAPRKEKYKTFKTGSMIITAAAKNSGVDKLSKNFLNKQYADLLKETEDLQEIFEKVPQQKIPKGKNQAVVIAKEFQKVKKAKKKAIVSGLAGTANATGAVINIAMASLSGPFAIINAAGAIASAAAATMYFSVMIKNIATLKKDNELAKIGKELSVASKRVSILSKNIRTKIKSLQKEVYKERASWKADANAIIAFYEDCAKGGEEWLEYMNAKKKKPNDKDQIEEDSGGKIKIDICSLKNEFAQELIGLVKKAEKLEEDIEDVEDIEEDEEEDEEDENE